MMVSRNMSAIFETSCVTRAAVERDTSVLGLGRALGTRALLLLMWDSVGCRFCPKIDDMRVLGINILWCRGGDMTDGRYRVPGLLFGHVSMMFETFTCWNLAKFDESDQDTPRCLSKLKEDSRPVASRYGHPCFIHPKSSIQILEYGLRFGMKCMAVQFRIISNSFPCQLQHQFDQRST
jgi:hypothetical protein